MQAYNLILNYVAPQPQPISVHNKPCQFSTAMSTSGQMCMRGTHSREPQQLEASGPSGPREWYQQSNRALQSFDHVSVDGNSRSHFGNFYQNVYYGTRKRSPSAEGEEVTHTQEKKKLSKKRSYTKFLRDLNSMVWDYAWRLSVQRMLRRAIGFFARLST